MKRLFFLSLITAFWASAALGQYQTPAVDGTISPGEYANSLGNYSMTWDATYLYLGVQVANPANAVSLYLDVDPLATPGGGTNANGNLIGYPDSGLGAELPFRADARILATSSGGEVRTRNGAGGWTGASTADVLTVDGTAREVRIAWSALTGSAAPPASFLWQAQQISGSTLLDPMPAAGPHAFFSVVSTVDGASTNPFSVQQSTWRVTSKDDAGPNTLRDAIDQANADTSSSRRFITFGLTAPTLIQTSSSLPWITQTTTVDGTSQNGGTTPAVTVRGFGTGAGGNGIAVNAPNCVVRGLVLQNHGWAIRFFIAPSGLIERNYVGTDETGTAARPNDNGISVAGSPGTIVGGDLAAGNVVGGNVTGVQFSESGVAVYGNRIGVGANGTTSIPNSIAVMSHGTNHTIGSPEQPNTIANNGRILDATNNGGLLVRGNATYANEAGMMIGNIRQMAPDIVSAVVNEGTLTIQTTLTPYAGTQGVRLDLYEADTTNLVPQGRAWHATSPCFSGGALTAQTWIAGTGYATRDKIVLTATAYSDAGCTTVGAGTSPFIGSVFTTTGTNTLFGDFSDPASWSSGALPAAGQNFIVKNGRFDIGSPEQVYGDMILGSRIGGGGLSFEAGNEETLHVNNIRSQNPASFISMAADTSLQVDGSFDPNLVFLPDTGTVTFGGAGQTIPAFNYFELEILAPIAGVTAGTLAGTMSVSSDLEIGNGIYDFSNATVELRGEGAIGTVGNGTAVFSDLVVPAGADAEADVSQITVNHLLTVNGTFAVGATTIVAGTGLLTGSGTVVVTGSAPTNSFASQYTLNRDIGQLTVFFEGEAAQSVDALNYLNLTIENAFGATVQGSGIVSVAGILSLEEGPFASGAGSIQLGPGASITSAGGWINGGVTATIATGSATYTFPVGIAAGATPMVVAFHDVTQSGTLFVGATAGEHPNLTGSGIDPARDANVYFRLQPAAGLTFASYDLTLTYGTRRDAAATPLAFKLRRYDGATWFPVASAVPMATGITASGLTAGGDFVTGNQLIDHYTVAASTPRVAGATFLTIVTARDLFDVPVSGNTIITVTMTSNTGHAQFDSNGDGTFGDNTKALINGTFSIVTKDNVAESVTLIATDANAKTGSTTVTIDPLLAPVSLSATAANTALVQLSWSAVTGATSYQIWRKSGGGYTLLATTGNTTYPDAAVTAGTSYVYQVRAVAGDVQSAFSPADAATTIVFTDPVLNNTVKVKAVHLTELRTAVNAMRAAAGLGAAVFTDPTITPQSTKIKAVHLAELRTALDQARAALGLPAIAYTDPTLTAPTTPVKAVHWMEVRAGTQ